MWQWGKNSWVGATSWYPCVAEDSRSPQMRTSTLSKHLFICKLNKKKLSCICIDCQSTTPTSQNSPFLVNRSADQELWLSIFQAIDELSLLQKSEFAVLDLGFEMLGLGLDSRGRTTKNAYCRIYSLGSKPPVRLRNSKKKKKLFRLDCRFWNTNFTEIAIFGGNSGKVGIVQFNYSRNWWVSALLAHGVMGDCWFCKFESLFWMSVFEKLGVEGENPGRTPEITHLWSMGVPNPCSTVHTQNKNFTTI